MFKERENKLLTQTRKEKTFQFDNWSSRRRFAFVKEPIKKKEKRNRIIEGLCLKRVQVRLPFTPREKKKGVLVSR